MFQTHIALILALLASCASDPDDTGSETGVTSSTAASESTTPTTSASSTTSGSSSGSASGASSSSGEPPTACGDGQVDPGEVCDDGNLVTELGEGAAWPLTYAQDACMADCTLALARCGDGVLDPGEGCDDGDADSTDGCTTSCTVNDDGYHAPCRRSCEPLDCDPSDPHEGDITGCAAVSPPDGGETVCLETGTSALVERHHAEGECVAMAQTCAGLCPPYLTFGDYVNFGACPVGTALVHRTSNEQGVMLQTRMCRKTCTSDAECRWNAVDAISGEPGRYRCRSTAESGDVPVCVDERE